MSLLLFYEWELGISENKEEPFVSTILFLVFDENLLRFIYFYYKVTLYNSRKNSVIYCYNARGESGILSEWSLA